MRREKVRFPVETRQSHHKKINSILIPSDCIGFIFTASKHWCQDQTENVNFPARQQSSVGCCLNTVTCERIRNRDGGSLHTSSSDPTSKFRKFTSLFCKIWYQVWFFEIKSHRQMFQLFTLRAWILCKVSWVFECV